MTTLISCTACARHVRSTEGACPFCDAAIEPSIGDQEPNVVNERLTRGALHARALAVGGAVGTATIVSVAMAASGCIMATPAYGAPAPIGASVSDTNGDAR